MKKTILLMSIMLILFVGSSVKATIWYSSGYNTFTGSDPQGEEIFVENDAILDFLSGNSSGLRVMHTATANIYGGTITNDLYTSDNSLINIYLVDLDILSSSHDSIVNVHAYDVEFYNTGGINNEGYMTGIFYQNHESFSIDFWNEETISHVNIVPEPTTFSLLVVSGWILRSRSFTKHIKH